MQPGDDGAEPCSVFERQPIQESRPVIRTRCRVCMLPTLLVYLRAHVRPCICDPACWQTRVFNHRIVDSTVGNSLRISVLDEHTVRRQYPDIRILYFCSNASKVAA